MENTLWQVWLDAAPGDTLALVDGASGETFTRADLTARAADLARRFEPQLTGSNQQAVVAFAEKNGPRWLTLFLALQRAGAVALPLDSALSEAQQSAMAAALGAHWLLLGAGDGEPAALHPLPSAADAGASAPGICLWKLTSGTTGQPKILPCSSDHMLADGRQVCATMDIRPDDVNLGAIPFGHSYGLGNLVLPLIAQGTPVVSSNEMLPSALAEKIARFRVTVFPTVPVVLRGLAESETDPAALATLRRVISAGAVLRPEVASAFEKRFGRRAHNFYGSSETGGICFDRSGDATLSGRAVGTPLEGVEVRLDDATGRVVVRSAAVVGAAGSEHILPDLGAWNEHGELRLIGRAAAAVANIGGKKVDPAEVERVLREMSGVSDAWVGVQARAEAAGGGDFLLAAVETTAGREEILRALTARLPAWQVPRRIFTRRAAAAHRPRQARPRRFGETARWLRRIFRARDTDSSGVPGRSWCSVRDRNARPPRRPAEAASRGCRRAKDRDRRRADPSGRRPRRTACRRRKRFRFPRGKSRCCRGSGRAPSSN